ncbi:epimerase [Paramagnetospirillum kuznetsovii]|uniref:Epimerase n=1 Tax=Paramagnetospirillum kuznetsovii TaxID=2053833 RepID=A0A364NY34_9PROT|nr:NAD-dependent epimerase/dehydratase family protein [Paramagnetospirillum kuznetsovii]RAU21815.1 epimerase [Paramagnetospirillum kuznetsovii]
MKWLITGGAGFLGRNLCRRLTDSGGHTIRVVDNLSVGGEEPLNHAMGGKVRICPKDMPGPMIAGAAPELIVADIAEAEVAVAAAAGADIIIHLAANTGVPQSVAHPRVDCITNVLGTLNYLEACRVSNVGRFVFASSGAPLGESTPPIHEESVPHPISPYGASKLAGEGYCSAYFHSYGVETVALRFGNVYGPGSGHKTSVVAKFIGQALRGEVLEIYGDGNQTRDFIHVDDLVDGILRASSVPGIGGEVFQIASGRETTLHELVEQLAAIFDGAGLPRPVVKTSEPRHGDVTRNFSDTSKAKQRLDWTPRVSLADGLRQTLRSLADVG